VSAWGIVGTLARASVEGGLFVAGVWILCRLVPRLPAALRCGLWWAACLKLLLGLVPLPAMRLPVLPAVERVTPVASAQPLSLRTVGTTLAPGPSPSPPPSQEEGDKRSLQEIGTVALMVLWLAGLLVLARRALRELRDTRRIVRSAERVREGWVRAAFAGICARLGLRRAPELRGSGEVRTPQVTGLAQPVVLIPRAGLERLTPSEVSMMLCHELVHLRRKDLWLGWVPALAHRIFFFHPLAALAAREYAIAREAACDAEVLRVLGSAPRDYGRLLLRWGVAPRETGLAAAGASPSLQTLKRRLQMLQSSDNSRRRRVSGWWWLAGSAVALAGLIPLRIVAQEPAPPAPVATPAPEVAEAPEAATPESAAPEATPAPEAAAGDENAPVIAPVPPRPPLPPQSRTPRASRAALPPVPPAPPRPALAPRAAVLAGPTPRPALAPLAPLPPGVPAPQALPPGATLRPGLAPRPMAMLAQGGGQLAPPAPPPAPPAPPYPPAPPAPPRHQHGFAYHTGGDESYVLFYGGSDSVTMSGDTEDLQRVRRLRGDSKEDFLWFRRGGKEYVVHDASLLKRIKELTKAQGELGARQGELGGRQGALGARQGSVLIRCGSRNINLS
jgi:bla regulator protein BlaR1